MNLNIIFLSILFSLNILIFALVTWTLYEFFKLDKEQFKYYIIGLFFYGIAVLCFFLRYIVLPPLADLESVIAAYGLVIPPLIGMFYFIKGTEDLAKREKPGFARNKKLHNIIFYLILIACVYQLLIQLLWFVVSESIYFIMARIAYILYLTVILLAMKLMLEYNKVFAAPIDRIIYQYILAVVLLIGGGMVAVNSLEPIKPGGCTFMDLSYLRSSMALIGEFIVFIPFVICFKSVAKFRKLLMR